MKNSEYMYCVIPKMAPEQKFNLSIGEACAYFNIGEKTLRAVVNSNPNASFILKVGNKTLIKKTLFEEFILKRNSI